MLFLGMTQKVVEHPLVNVFDCHQMKRTRTIGERERERERRGIVDHLFPLGMVVGVWKGTMMKVLCMSICLSVWKGS